MKKIVTQVIASPYLIDTPVLLVPYKLVPEIQKNEGLELALYESKEFSFGIICDIGLRIIAKEKKD